MLYSIGDIANVLRSRAGETLLDAAGRVYAERQGAIAMLGDIASLCSATDDETAYASVERLMSDYRDVVRQRDALVHERGTIEWTLKRCAASAFEIEERIAASRVGRAALSVAKAWGVLSDLARGCR